MISETKDYPRMKILSTIVTLMLFSPGLLTLQGMVNGGEYWTCGEPIASDGMTTAWIVYFIGDYSANEKAALLSVRAARSF